MILCLTRGLDLGLLEIMARSPFRSWALLFRIVGVQIDQKPDRFPGGG